MDKETKKSFIKLIFLLIGVSLLIIACIVVGILGTLGAIVIGF